MKFRKLLAFVLVFSMATQPGGVRFGYAEDAKAAEVENKAEESDELGIDLDEAELDEYLFDPGSREQDLEETASVAAEKAAEKSTFSGAVVAAKAASVAAVTAAVGTAGLMIYNGASNRGEIAKLWTAEGGSFFSRLGKTISILFKGAKKVVEETKKEPTGIDSYDNYLAGEGALSVDGTTRADHAEEKARKEEEQLLENNKIMLQTGAKGLQSRIDALKEEHKGTLQDELDTVKATIENATSVEALEGVDVQLTTFEGKVTEAEVAQNEAERLANDLIEKKNSALNTLNKLEDTCGLDTVGFKRELSAIDLWTLTTPEELAQAEIKLNSIINRINGLRGNCFAIKSDKDYIEKNWPTAYNVLDKSDFALNLAWNMLKDKTVTEDNLKDLAGEYKKIAGRVKAVIDNNNAISKSTDKISKAISDHKYSAWFDGAYYNGQLDEISKKAKTEESLPKIKSELDMLLAELNINYSSKDIKAVKKAISKIENSAIVKETCTQSSYLGIKKENKLTSEQCNTLKDKFVAERDRLVEEAKSNRSLVGLAEKLKNLYDNTDEYINDVAKLNADASEIDKLIKNIEASDWFDAKYCRERFKELVSEYSSLDDLKTKRADMKQLSDYLMSAKKLDGEINELISGFGNYKTSYKKQYDDKYQVKCEELKKEHDLSKVVNELETFKKDLETRLNNLKTFCENRPEKCGK